MLNVLVLTCRQDTPIDAIRRLLWSSITHCLLTEFEVFSTRAYFMLDITILSKAHSCRGNRLRIEPAVVILLNAYAVKLLDANRSWSKMLLSDVGNSQ